MFFLNFSRYDCRKTPTDGLPAKLISGFEGRRLSTFDPDNDEKDSG